MFSLKPPRTSSDEYYNLLADLNGKLAVMNDEMCFRERTVALIDLVLHDIEQDPSVDESSSLQFPKLPRPKLSIVTDSLTSRSRGLAPQMDISALRKEHKRSQTEDLPRITFNPTPINATSDGNAEGDVYSYAMTLFEIFAYGTEALSQTNTDRMERNVLKARPSLGPLVWLSPPRPRYFETLINQSALQQPPRQDDVQMALKSIRMSLHAANLRIHRLAEVRAWFDAQYRTQCIQIALTFLGAVPEGNLSPLTASQRQTIFSAMFSDIRDMFALSANIHLQPAQPRADDTITITRVPTIFEEPRVRVLIRALSEPLKLHFQNLAAIARYNLQAEPIPFAVNLT